MANISIIIATLLLILGSFCSPDMGQPFTFGPKPVHNGNEFDINSQIDLPKLNLMVPENVLNQHGFKERMSKNVVKVQEVKSIEYEYVSESSNEIDRASIEQVGTPISHCHVALSGTDGPTCGPVGTPCRTIKFALEQRISSSAVVDVMPGTYSEFNMTTFAKSITLRKKPLSVGSVVIDAEKRGHILWFRSTADCSYDIQHISFINGRRVVPSNPAGILPIGGVSVEYPEKGKPLSVKIDHCSFKNHVTFIDIGSTMVGSTVYTVNRYHGAAVSILGASFVSVTNSIFEDNNAVGTSAFGSGLEVFFPDGPTFNSTINVSKCQFLNNKIGYHKSELSGSGALSFTAFPSLHEQSRLSITIEDNEFKNNAACGGGGAIFGFIQNAIASYNTSSEKDRGSFDLEYFIRNNQFIENESGRGGAVCIIVFKSTNRPNITEFDDHLVRIEGNSFVRNKVVGLFGGALVTNWIGSGSYGLLHLDYALKNNRFVQNSVNPMVLGGTTLAGALELEIVDLSWPELVFSQTKYAHEIELKNLNSSVMNEIMKELIEIKLMFIENTYERNFADGTGGAVFISQQSGGGHMQGGTRNATFINETFRGNNASVCAAGLYVMGDPLGEGFVDVTGLVIESNVGHSVAAVVGFIFQDAMRTIGPYNLSMRNSRFSNNIGQIVGPLGVSIITRRYKEGELYHDVSPANIEILESNFTNNVVKSNAGGTMLKVPDGNVLLRNCIFRGNAAGDVGAAIFVDNSNADFVLDSVTFEDNICGKTRLGECFYGSVGGKITFKDVSMTYSASNSTSVTGLFIPSSKSIIQSNLIQTCGIGSSFSSKTAEFISLSPDGVSSFSHFLINQCSPCPSGLYSLVAGDSVNSVSSTSSTSSTSQSQFCFACPVGASCNGGANITALHTYYGYIAQNKAHFANCPNGYCQGTRSMYECSRSRKGRLCGTCVSGTSLAIDSTNCVPNSKCGKADQRAIYAFQTIAIVIFYAVTMLFRPAGKTAHLRVSVYFQQIIGTVSAHLAFNGVVKNEAMEWFQSVRSWIAGVASAKFSSDPSAASSVASTSNSGLCPFPGLDPVTKLAMDYMMPFILGVMLLIVWVSLALLKFVPHRIATPFGVLKLKKRAEDINPDDPEREAKMKKANMSASQRLRPRFFIAMLRLAQYSYSTMLASTLGLLHCYSIHSNSTVQNKYISVLFVQGDVECGQWYQYLVGILILPFLLAFPILLWYVPWLIRRKGWLNDGSKLVLESLENPYEEKYRWWEAIVIGRRLVIALFATFITDPVYSSFFIALACILALAAQLLISPFLDIYTDFAEATSLTVIAIVASVNYFASGILSYGQITDSVKQTMVNFSTLTEVLMLIIVLYTVVVVVFMAYKSIRDIWEQIRENGLLFWRKKQKSGGSAVPI